MHARHYSPALGRFVQPDPSGAEANLYGYAQDSPVSQIDPSGLDTLDQLGRMNFYEWLLCITHPRQCADWHDISSYAFRVGPAVGRGGDARDAIRHCTWQCLLAKVMGPGNAAMWAIAHEARWEGASTIMDMHNNAVGRSLARYVPWHYTVLAGKGYSVSTRWVNFPDAYRLCGQALRAGDLWVLDHGRAVPFER